MPTKNTGSDIKGRRYNSRANSIQFCSAYLVIPCERLQQRYGQNYWGKGQSRPWVWTGSPLCSSSVCATKVYSTA